ncbi:hypothetical protein Glove_851g17 [Diversispora epigaea]|uniref:Protein kinase domain-containing protein n=1 Tax=Diversispora epigaea TaxID=1348612 RepID=A0A397G4Q9_9GLOM|nr:hypothetical protein Glove_851g17 [Diversispora epigaea]
MTSRNSIIARLFKVFYRRRTRKNVRTTERSTIRTNDDITLKNLQSCQNNLNQQLGQLGGQLSSGSSNNNNNNNSTLRPISVNNNNPADRLSTGMRRDWRSGYTPIDELLQEMRLEFPNPAQHLNWIPFEEFVNCIFTAKGGFSTIYEATWSTSGKTVSLKSLNNSQNLSIEYLNELKKNWILFLQPQFLRCYGITQQPTTGEFMMVMQYAPYGDLRSLQRNNSTLSWKDKVQILQQITSGICEIHKRELIHGDLHSGNILGLEESHFVIADVGLCGPANKSPEKKEIYGVVPYLAPEVLKGHEPTKKSDTYSFAIIMWEICAGCKPYLNIAHDADLVNEIIKGKRPPIPINTPSFYSQLMISCWDPNPSKRPDFDDVSKTICHWLVDDSLEASLRKGSSKSALKNSSKRPHPDAVYFSRILDFPEFKEARRRQYHSLNIPRSVSDQGTETLINEYQASNNQTQTSTPTSTPTSTQTSTLTSEQISTQQISKETSSKETSSSNQLLFPPLQNSHTLRNSYNNPPTFRDANTFSTNTKEQYKFSPPKEYSFLSQPPPPPPGIQNERPLNNPRGIQNVISIFIPDDDIKTLQTFWASEGRNMSRKSLSNLI